MRLEGAEAAPAAAKPDALQIRSADAFLYGSDILNVDTEWTDDPALLADKALQFTLTQAENIVATVTQNAPVPLRVRTCLQANGLAPGDYVLNVALVDSAANVIASATRPCRVVKAPIK